MRASHSVATWHRSTRCSSGACVEVAALGRSVLVRDAKENDGPKLAFASGAWMSFVATLKDGQLHS
jgi:hypothetical protein